MDDKIKEEKLADTRSYCCNALATCDAQLKVSSWRCENCFQTCKIKEVHEANMAQVKTAEDLQAYNELLLKSIAKQARLEERTRIIKRLQEIKSEEWHDAEHCSCLAYAIDNLITQTEND